MKVRGIEIEVPCEAPESQEQQMEAIRAALSSEYSLPASEDEEEDEQNDDSPKEEVLYSSGATPLFMAIEETEWRKALTILQDDPQQAKTWVRSNGTVETTFDWSLWRRLAIHEACRRQAPAWLVSQLLSVYPESAQAETQFGELPLHLAVECGSAPEVVNLLIAYHWMGCQARDKSGRTPLEIVRDTELLHEEDIQVVYQSLKNSQDTYETIQKEHANHVDLLQTHHAAGLVAIRRQHDDDLLLEQEQQDKLLQEVERLKTALTAAQQTNEAQQARIDTFSSTEMTWKSMNQVLKRMAQELEASKEEAVQKAKTLEHLVELKNEEIAQLQKQIQELSTDLQGVQAWHDQKLSGTMNKTERRLRKMVDSFVTLHDCLLDHVDELKGVMESRGIEVLQDDEKKEGESENRPEAAVTPDILNAETASLSFD